MSVILRVGTVVAAQEQLVTAGVGRGTSEFVFTRGRDTTGDGLGGLWSVETGLTADGVDVFALPNAPTYFLRRCERTSRRSALVNPQVFAAADTLMRVSSGGAGLLTLQPAATGHVDQPISNIIIHFEAGSGYTSLATHPDYQQDGTPLSLFEPTKGYLVYISRFNSGGGNVAYAVTGRVVAA